jgi:hypothetical protein
MRANASLSLILILTLSACSGEARELVSPRVPDTSDGVIRQQTLVLGERWNLQDVEADFPGLYSLDTTQAGAQATYYVAPAESEYDPERAICRDHFKPIDLWWDGGYGLMSFHLDPPLLFVGFSLGTFRSPRGLVFQKAVYETIQTAEAVDPAGNVWRFQGRFNALCRGGEMEVGPLVFGGQLLVSQNPITRPVLVRRGAGGGDDGCGDGTGEDAYYMESYDPYSPVPDEDAVIPSCGGSTGGAGGNYTCWWDYVTLEISYDGGQTWHFFWSGWAQVCDSEMA